MVKDSKPANSFLFAAKNKLSAVKLMLGRRLGLIRSVMIMPYMGFGNQKELYFQGRVLRDRGIGLSRLEDSSWRNFAKMYKRFMTWEIPFVKVRASLGGVSVITETDEEGYFSFHISLSNNALLKAPWQVVKLKLENYNIRGKEAPETVNRILIASENSEYGIISDIDDTIVPTGATRLIEMFKTTFFRNAHSRVPFAGVAAFYQALAKGESGQGNNPFFYVSSSPWNLYDFLMEVMVIHKIPEGPLMLRDIGLSKEHLFSGSHTGHKLKQVERIFRIIDALPFILIGDSGQHDAEIYLQVVKDFPGRIKAVYIRDVSERNHKKMLEISEDMKKYGVEMILVKDTVEAAIHAVSKRWIAEGEVWDVKGEKEEGEGDF